MTEVYSVLNQAPTENFWFVPVIFGIFGGVIFLILLINLIRMITTQKIFVSKLVINILSMGFIVFWSVLLIWFISDDNRLYEDYRSALENNTCLVESGTPDGLEIYRDRTDEGDDYEITFYLNGKYFDSYLAYSECNFSKTDIRLIDGSEIFEVKYIVDENNDNIILSMSVAAD